jgi:hypothetical protein
MAKLLLWLEGSPRTGRSVLSSAAAMSAFFAFGGEADSDPNDNFR